MYHKKQLVLSVIFLGLFAQAAYSNEPLRYELGDGAVQNGVQQRAEVSKAYPFDPTSPAPGWVQTDRFKQENVTKEFDNAQRNQKRFRDALDGTFDLSVLQRPVQKVFKSIDTLYFHPNYITTIMVPKSYTIVPGSAHASFQTNFFSVAKDSNILMIQPSKDFNNGNMVMTLTDGKENYFMTINAIQYFSNMECRKSQGNYKCADEYLSTTYKYTLAERLTTDLKVRIMETLKRMYKTLDFEKKKSYSVEFKGINYYVYEDEMNGDFFFHGKNLKISTGRY